MPRIWEGVILPQSTWVQQESMESPDTDTFISVPFHREADYSTQGQKHSPEPPQKAPCSQGRGSRVRPCSREKLLPCQEVKVTFSCLCHYLKGVKSGLRACSVSTFSCSLHTRRGAALQGIGPPLSSSPFPFGLACQRSSRGCIWPGNDMLTPSKSWVKIPMRADRSCVWHSSWVCSSSRHWGCTLQV